MGESTPSKINPLTQQLTELNTLLEKRRYNNADHYAYYFNAWKAKTLYLLANIFGNKSTEYTRFEKAATLPTGTAKEAQWVQYRKRVMLRTYGELEAILSTPHEQTNTRQSKKQENGKSEGVEEYIDQQRIDELRNIKADDFDLSKLIALCVELNQCYANECYMAVAMLVRAIMDHVPPIFNCATFTEVENNYAGSKSFKGSMGSLDKSLRKIADAHLHQQIRKSETIPTKPQVRFSPDLDVLLSEIARILK